MCVCVYKEFCPEAGPSLDMHYQGSTYLSLLDKRNSEVVCQVLSSLSQWPYRNTFHCTQIQLLSIPIPQIAPKLWHSWELQILP